MGTMLRLARTLDRLSERTGQLVGWLTLAMVLIGAYNAIVRYLESDSVVGLDDSWVALDGARVVASTQIFDKSIRLNGQVVTIGGIGSVATQDKTMLPTTRRSIAPIPRARPTPKGASRPIC